VTLLDVQGRVVFQEGMQADASNAEIVIPVSELSRGVYTLNITSKDASHSEKIFIE